MMDIQRSICKTICAAVSAVMIISLAGCGKQEIRPNRRPITRTSPEAVAADTVLESLPDDSAEDSTAETSAETAKKKKKKTKETEASTTAETTTTTEPEPEIPDVRREQPYLGAADYDDFSDACFIGASQTVGLSLFGGKVDPDFYAYAGLNVDTIFTKKFLTEDGRTAAVSDSDGVSEDGLFTVMDMLDKKSYSRIYILFGINEMGGWIDYDHFYSSYVNLIREIRGKQPSAIIYVESVLPVNKYAVNTNHKFTNENIDNFNSNYVRPAANEAGAVFVNINPMFKCENGSLPKDASADGIHMTQSYCREWMDMLAYYAPAGGPTRPMPEDYSPDNGTQPQPEQPRESADPGELPPEVVPVPLPDVVIPDIPEDTTAPAEEIPEE